MDLIQHKGPFAYGQIIRVEANTDYSYVHIGIQIPKRQPIGIAKTIVRYGTSIEDTTTVPKPWVESRQNPMVEINGISYQINANDVLEFDGLSEVDWTIKFLTPMPPEAIVDIVRKG